ncbi:MAG: molybdenum ABC transporter ATP-binding protein [Paracoccus sp. (in: a-proteobacteria)]|uniref:molybdenum ABC transporter ATP-binding protein n=1 Tax=Paracoccus sp. TaxID=267 RepID=UPI0026DEDE4E|nr:molybdenum ABC transporter ATP-binding protein [Paracoccus sp. (in: a-proteobacteria)]MDO5631196.1 molybdenum ABC transporter ATP-binding protein [Paracoccus sp. (in: a-proteobacteria)]
MSLSVAFRKAFPGLSLDVAFDAPAGVTAIYGPSGCGKTTTINAIAGLMTPDAGRITLNGRNLWADDHGLPPHQRRIGYVFQDARLFPHLSVAGNLDYPARFAPAPPDAAARARVIDMLDIGALLHRRPAGLSGGERQRVAIGRALLSSPDLLILDEPLASLDPARKAEILPFLMRLRQAKGPPILYVSHSMAEIARLADTLIVMTRGRVAYVGPLAAALSDPAAARTIGGAEGGAILPATVAGPGPDGLTRLDTPAGPILLADPPGAPGTALHLRILAHEVMLARQAPTGLSALNVLPARVTALSESGSRVLVQLAMGEARMLAEITVRSVTTLNLHPGSDCFAVIKTVALIRQS